MMNEPTSETNCCPYCGAFMPPLAPSDVKTTSCPTCNRPCGVRFERKTTDGRDYYVPWYHQVPSTPEHPHPLTGRDMADRSMNWAELEAAILMAPEEARPAARKLLGVMREVGEGAPVTPELRERALRLLEGRVSRRQVEEYLRDQLRVFEGAQLTEEVVGHIRDAANRSLDSLAHRYFGVRSINVKVEIREKLDGVVTPEGFDRIGGEFEIIVETSIPVPPPFTLTVKKPGPPAENE